MDFSNGGQEVVHRLLDAYGYKTRQALCEKLGVSKSTMASRYSRDIFPADWVIQTAIDTGINVEWLSFGTGEKYSNENVHLHKIPSMSLVDGRPEDGEPMIFDERLIPKGLTDPCVIFSPNLNAVLDMDTTEIGDGLWLVEIDDRIDFRHITRLPKQMVRVTNEVTSFECSIKDLRFLGQVVIHLGKA
ncbi:phage repressor protein CI [Erwinia billingiae]|uniref:phage repressor protein CI n=1 Tax=Erwinia billingiae TaxID=182337 RepID=UPI003209514F